MSGATHSSRRPIRAAVLDSRYAWLTLLAAIAVSGPAAGQSQPGRILVDNTGPSILTYNRDELIRDLNQVLPYDWATFIHDRIDNINPHADLAGIERRGYRLIYTDKPTPSERTIAMTGGPRRGGINVWYSLGLRVSNEGVIADVRWGGPADKANIGLAQRSSR